MAPERWLALAGAALLLTAAAAWAVGLAAGRRPAAHTIRLGRLGLDLRGDMHGALASLRYTSRAAFLALGLGLVVQGTRAWLEWGTLPGSGPCQGWLAVAFLLTGAVQLSASLGRYRSGWPGVLALLAGASALQAVLAQPVS